MAGPPHRRTLTPLQSELRPEEPLREPPPPGPLTRLRRRLGRTRRPPKTLRGAIAAGLGRLAIAIGVASALALLVDRYADRSASFGFYVVGTFVLIAAILMSTADTGTPYYYSQLGRERRVSLSFSYVLAGGVVLGIAVLVDTLAG